MTISSDVEERKICNKFIEQMLLLRVVVGSPLKCKMLTPFQNTQSLVISGASAHNSMVIKNNNILHYIFYVDCNIFLRMNITEMSLKI